MLFCNDIKLYKNNILKKGKIPKYLNVSYCVQLIVSLFCKNSYTQWRVETRMDKTLWVKTAQDLPVDFERWRRK